MRFPEERQTLTTRITVLRVAAVVLFVLLAVSFWFFQIIQHAKFQEMAENNHQRELPLRAPRGVLFDRNGRVLVENRPSFNVSIVRLHTTNLDRTIRLLVGGGRHRRAAHAGGRGPPPATSRRTGRSSSSRTRRSRRWPRSRRAGSTSSCPTSSCSRCRRGSTRPTSSPRTCSGTWARPPRRRSPRATRLKSGDIVGQAGFERSHNPLLMGKDGVRTVIVNSVGREMGAARSRRADRRAAACG